MFLGIDVGTTVLKAGLFDPADGKCLAFQTCRLPLLKGDPEAREQDPKVLLRLLDQTLSHLKKQVGSVWAEVCGIGLATQGGSTLIVDRATGAPKTPLILWNDPRAFDEFRRIRESHPPEYWCSFSLRDEPGMGLARLAGLRKTSPELFTEGNLYVGAGELVYHHLTGEWRQDPCHALQTGCYDAVNNCLTKIPLDTLGVDLSFFAPLRDPKPVLPLSPAAAGRMNLNAGIPVAGPYIDQEAGFLSARSARKAPLQLSLGTAWVGNFILGPGISGRSPFQLSIPAPGESGRLIIQPLLAGNVAWDWALKTFVGGHGQRALVEAGKIFERSLLPGGGLISLPWLNRPNPLRPEHLGGLSFFGAGPSSDREDLLRAVALGMVCELRRAFEEVCHKGLIECLVVSGGAGKGHAFQQLIGHLFSPLPVKRILEEDLAATRGCLSFFETPAASSPMSDIQIQNPDLKSRLDELYQLYLEVFSRIYGKDPSGTAFQINRCMTREENQ